MIILLLVFCVFNRITPFGDRTFLMFDLKRQYVDFYAYLRSVLSGDNNIFYSFSTALGSGMIGFEAYYLSSPLLFLLNVFPQETLPMGITILICLKLVIAAVIMNIFLQYYVGFGHTGKIFASKGIAVLAGSVAWSFSGFLFAHSMNLMWIDVIMLFPIFIWTFDKVFFEDRKMPYIFMVALLLWLNYYITFQVLLFSVLWGVYRLFTGNPNNKFKIFLRFVIATFTGVIIDGIILLPTGLELFDSPKDIRQLGLETAGHELSVMGVLSKVPVLSYDQIEARFGWPQVYCGLLFAVLIVLFFLSRNIKRREKAGIGILLSVMMLSFTIDQLNLIWHAGMEPSGHPYRQAFIWTFLVVISGTKALSELDSLDYKKTLFAIGTVGVILVLVLPRKYDHISRKTIEANIALIVIYLCLFVLYIRTAKSTGKRMLVEGGILILLIVELFCNASYTYMWQSKLSVKASEYSKGVIDSSEAVRFVKNIDESFYRMENLNPRQQNDAMQYFYNGVTHYSSAGKTYVRYVLQRLGFNDDGLYTNYGHDNTIAADMILGIKYILSDGTYPAHCAYKEVKSGNVSVYENPFYASLAFETDDFDAMSVGCPAGMISSNNWDEFVPKKDPFRLQEDILNRLTNEKNEIFVPADIEIRKYHVDEDGMSVPNIEYAVTAAEDGEMYMYIDDLPGYAQGLTIYVNGELFTTYGNDACRKILNLGFMEKADIANIRIDGGSENPDFGSAVFVSEKADNLSKVAENLEGRAVNIVKSSSSYLKMEVGDCKGIFMTVPAEKGWKISVDGKKTDAFCVYGAFTYIPIENPADRHFVVMEYAPVGMNYGIIISVLGILLAVGIYMTEKKALANEKS